MESDEYTIFGPTNGLGSIQISEAQHKKILKWETPWAIDPPKKPKKPSAHCSERSQSTKRGDSGIVEIMRGISLYKQIYLPSGSILSAAKSLISGFKEI